MPTSLTIHHTPATPPVPPVALNLHAWDGAGRVTDSKGTPTNSQFTFQVTLDRVDARSLQFKYWYPKEDRWESDTWIRAVPTSDARELWTFDFTRRTLRRAPGPRSTLSKVRIHVLTRAFQGGQLYAWRGDASAQFTQSSATADEIVYDVPLQDWMRDGFYFKLTVGNEWEPDACNRIWVPSDGAEVWVLAGHFGVLASRPVPVDIALHLVHTGASPVLLRRLGLDTQPVLAAASKPLAPHSELVRSDYRLSVFQDVGYNLHWERENLSLETPFRMRAGDPVDTWSVLGVYGFYDQQPQLDATLEFIVHPNPGSHFGDRLHAFLGISGQDDPYQSIDLYRQDGVWRGTANGLLSSGVPHWLTLMDPHGAQEARPDGPFEAKRHFGLNAGQNVLHTADGVAEVSSSGGPAFQEIPWDERQRLMAEVFASAATVFDPWELPLGSTYFDDQVLFVVKAPYAVKAELVLDGRWSPVPMSLTHDLRYWWATLPAADAPPLSRYRYRFNDVQWVLDPAARFVVDDGRLATAPDNPQAWQSWTLTYDIRTVHGPRFLGQPWDALTIYELHPERFTDRHPDLAPLARLTAELDAGGYLTSLPVTALELMPVHEYQSDRGWGYNPSLFFAVESSYGGPDALKQMVDTAHADGKAVILDVVFNHMQDSPLQVIARDIYVDGQTAWGDMVNYDHPAVIEYFRQALVWTYCAFRVDGFRFDCTEVIVNGHRTDTDSAKDILYKDAEGRLHPGSGGGWEFLQALGNAVRGAADATGQPWPYLVAENAPNNWPLSDYPDGAPLTSQWDFSMLYKLGDAARNVDDHSVDVANVMMDDDHRLRPMLERVLYAESHDSVSMQDDSARRIVAREAWGNGRRMTKAMAALTLLLKGVPMLFMGQEAGESEPFRFGSDDVLPLSSYLQGEMAQVRRWYEHLLGFRRDPNAALHQMDGDWVAGGDKTVSFPRGGGRYFVVVTLGGDGVLQRPLSLLGLPEGRAYKEIFNSAWSDYTVQGEDVVSNGGPDAWLTRDSEVRLPSIGAVVLESH